MANRILIVEDEEKLARMVELELTYEGYQVERHWMAAPVRSVRSPVSMT